VLVNNAAVYEPFLVAEATDEQILKIIATNLAGPIFCARAAIPLMGSGAHIINLSSESVELPFPHLSVYQCSKAGLERFSQALEQELAPQGIRVTTVRAGQMMDADKTWDIDPQVAARFGAAAMAVGLNLREAADLSVQVGDPYFSWPDRSAPRLAGGDRRAARPQTVTGRRTQ